MYGYLDHSASNRGVYYLFYTCQVPLSVRMVSQTTVLKSVLETQTLELTTAAVSQDTRLILMILQLVMVSSLTNIIISYPDKY